MCWFQPLRLPCCFQAHTHRRIFTTTWAFGGSQWGGWEDFVFLPSLIFFLTFLPWTFSRANIEYLLLGQIFWPYYAHCLPSEHILGLLKDYRAWGTILKHLLFIPYEWEVIVSGKGMRPDKYEGTMSRSGCEYSLWPRTVGGRPETADGRKE